MSYRSEPIQIAISKLNVNYFLPAIQREYVWKPEQVVQLFDSVLRRYPIGSFLFWELDADHKDQWEAYKFVHHARQGGTHNELGITDGAQSLTLILDGQQRLTSLLLGLKGFYTVKKKHKRWADQSAWMNQRLYLNLLKDPVAPASDNMDAESGLYYDLQMFDEPPPSDTDQHWFRVGRILDVAREEDLFDFVDAEVAKLPGTATRDAEKTLRKNLERLYRAIWKDEVIAYYSERDQDYDRVLDIFVRANDGGTKLSKSDLLLSMVTSKWGDINAREEIFSFMDRLNTDLTLRNDFDKDFIMKSCLVLTDLPVAYRVQNFNNANLNKIQASWPQIKSATERAVDLANSFGIDRENLTSANALVPIAYYFMHCTNKSLRGSTPFEVQNAAIIRKWLIAALLNGVFGGSSDNILRDIREVLSVRKGADIDFPMDDISQVISKSNRIARFDENSIENVIDMTYGRRTTFLALSLLYDDVPWGTIPHQQDHLLAQASFSAKALEQHGIPTDQRWKWQTLYHRLANLVLLKSDENQGKSDKPFHEWMTTRDGQFKRRHLIPNDPKLWRIERFPEFIEAREELIRQRLSNLIVSPEAAGVA